MSESCDSPVCSRFHQSIELIGRRWSGAILYALCQRPRRFSDFKEVIPELSDRLLTERLKELEDAGLVVREVGTGRPVQVTYRLSPKGADLEPVLDALRSWACRWDEAEV